MTIPPPFPAAFARDVFTRAAARDHVTDRRLRGPGIAKVGHGVYVAADEATYVHRIAGYRSRVGEGPVLLGPTAAFAHGACLARAGDDLHARVGSGADGGVGVRVYRVPLTDADVVVTRFGRATTPGRTAVDLARGVGLAGHRNAVRLAWVEALMHATGLSAATVRALASSATRLRDLPRARVVLEQCRDGAESVRETLLRVLIVREGFPEPTVQLRVRTSDGVVVARLDLGWEDHRAGAEYDGADHLGSARHSRDLERHNALRSLDWRVLQVDKRVLADPRFFLADLGRLVPRAPTPPLPAFRQFWA
jgi:very-short-patch-repair endonuclease